MTAHQYRDPSVIDYAKRFARGLYQHARYGRHDPEGVQGWLHLDIRTNCLVSDATSLGLRVIQPRQRYGTTRGVLGNFNKQARGEAVASMKRDGFYVFPQKMPSLIVDALESVMRANPGKLYPIPASGTEHAVYEPGKPLGPTYYYRQKFVPEMQALMVDENFVAIATEYLGVDPILHTAQSWLSVPFGTGPSSENAQLYHADFCNMQMFKTFVYLTDVTTDNGPHCLVRGSHRSLEFTGAKFRRRGAVRISDEEITSIYGSARQIEIIGPRGTVFAVDTRAFHKGKVPTAGERRIVELYYINTNFGMPSDVHEIENPTPEFIAAGKRWPRLLHYFPAKT